MKGLAARSYARAAISAPFVAENITTILRVSAKGAAAGCNVEEEELACNLRWNGGGAADSGLGEAFNVLAVVQGLLTKTPLPASSSGNSTATGDQVTSTSAPSGSAQPAESDGAASALTLSHGLIFAVVVLATVSL